MHVLEFEWKRRENYDGHMEALRNFQTEVKSAEDHSSYSVLVAKMFPW